MRSHTVPEKFIVSKMFIPKFIRTAAALSDNQASDRRKRERETVLYEISEPLEKLFGELYF